MATKRPQRILVIDDSDDIRESYEALLQAEGYLVATAPNGEVGLDVTRTFRPDLVIVDVIMPGMDGLEYLAHMRSDFAPPLPAVILSSGFASAEAEAKQRGAYAFVPKPVAVPELLAVVAHVLSSLEPEQSVLSRARELAATARSSAVESAQHSADNASDDLLLLGAGSLLKYMRGYFGADDAFAGLIRDGRLILIGADGEIVNNTSSPRSIGEIIATGSTLVLPDVRKHVAFAAELEDLSPIRSFVGVPVLASSGGTSGAVCLARTKIDPFTIEDVLMLEFAGRRTAKLLERVHERAENPLADFPLLATGATERSVFEFIVEMELRLAARYHHAVELVLVDLVGPPTYSAVTATIAPAHVRRWAIGALGPRRLGFFKRADDGDEVVLRVNAALQALRSMVPIAAAGSVSIAGDATSLFDAQTLLRVAERALARSSGGGRVERLFIGPAEPSSHATP